MERLKERIISSLAGLVQFSSIIFHPAASAQDESLYAVILCLNADIQTHLQTPSENHLRLNRQSFNLESYQGRRMYFLGIGSIGSHEALYLYQTPDIYALPNRVGPVDLGSYGTEDSTLRDNLRNYFPRAIALRIPGIPSDPRELIAYCFKNSSMLV